MRSQPRASLTLLKVLVAIFRLHNWFHLGDAKPCPCDSTHRSTWLSLCLPLMLWFLDDKGIRLPRLSALVRAWSKSAGCSKLMTGF